MVKKRTPTLKGRENESKMAFPKVEIQVQNGQLGQTEGTEDSVAGLVCTGVAIVDKIAINEPKQIFGVKDAEALGFSDAVNPEMYAQIVDFYSQAGEGAELWILIQSEATLMASILDVNNANATVLLDAAQGRIRILGITRKADGAYAPVYADGIDPDVITSIDKAQELAEAYAAAYKPLRVVIGGRDYQGVIADLADLTERDDNRVAVLLAGKGEGSLEACVGLALGRLAAIPVQRKIARVKDGDLGLVSAYLSDGVTTIDELSEAQLEAIHNKGYIVLRKYFGRNGYFFTDDPTATGADDDYNTISRGRVIDKAISLAYTTYVNELQDDVELDPATGRLEAGVIKSYQALIKRAIEQNMLADGEISSVSVVIDPLQDVLTSNKVEVTVNILPKGYSSVIVVKLGFTNPANS
tara:strand:+ start:528 stop:1766 length:1239 start_codon:yes stop_codon:yes gene_type:complete